MSKNKFLQLLCVFAMAVSLAIPFTACGQPDEGGEKVPCETHTYGEWTESKAPTCAEAGEEVRTCTVCEESETRTIAATGEHAYTWTVTTVATCDTAGVEAGVCGVCGGETTRETAKDKNNHTLWTDWETVSDATCKETGLRFRVCLDCETEETEDVAINPDAHTFGAYYDTVAATCSEVGSRKHDCALCGTTVTEEIAIDPDAHAYETTVENAATCIAEGVAKDVCADCGDTKDGVALPIDIYNHTDTKAWGAETRCDGCGGLLSSMSILDNSAGKCVNSRDLFFDGDFEVVYTFENVCGSDGWWHNWMFDLAPAAYLNGSLIKLDRGTDPLVPIIPWYDGTYYNEYHPYIIKYGGNVETTWFFTQDGVEKDFGESMKGGTDTVATLKRVGDKVTVVSVMTTKGETPATCTITAEAYFPGVQYLCVALTGESNRALISQISVKQGTACPATQAQTGTELLPQSIVIDNSTGKNSQGIDRTYDGDFDLEVDFTMTGDPTNDWHSWIFYVFKGIQSASLGNADTLFWSGTANGAEPEQYALYHDMNHIYYRHDYVGEKAFIPMIADADVTLRIVRTDGYIAIFGIAYSNDEAKTPISNWKYIAGTAYTDTVTVRLTSELSSAEVTSMIEYKGTHNHVTEDVVTKQATCSATGLKDVVCKICGEVTSKDVEIAINPEAHKYVSSTATEATCVSKGMTGSNQCEYCGAGAAPMEIPVNIYNHKNTQAWGSHTRCNDCNGILSEAYTLSNTAGKYTASHETFFDGDFEIVYAFYNTCGSDRAWHNWMFDVMPAVYLDGTLEKLERGNDPLAPVIPWYDGTYYSNYHPYFVKYGGSVETTWFYTASGVEKGFAESMAVGTDTVATVKRVGNTVYLTVVMTTREEDPATCTITATLNFAGVQYLCVAMTGEGNVAQIEQIQIVSGTACPATKTEEGTQLISEAVTVTNANGAKNVEAKDFTFDGDFDLEVEFVMNGNPGSDWHSWIFLVFKGTQGGALGDANTLFWAGTANGAEPEQYALYHGMDFVWYRYDFVSNFAEALATAKITLRITRIDGYLTVFGHAQTNDANSTLIAEWKYIAGTQYSDTVTVRLTSENAAFTMNRAELLKGNLYVAHVTEE